MVLRINSNSLTRPLESTMISILLSSPDLFFYKFYYLLYANLTWTTEQSLWTVNLAFGLCTSCPLVWNHHHAPPLPELLRGYLQLKLPPTLIGFPGYLFAELLYEVKWSESSSIMSDSMDSTVRGNSLGHNTGGVTFPFSRGSSQPRDQTQFSCTEGRFFTSQATREAV